MTKQRLNMWKKRKKTKKNQIWILGHECACTYIGYACASQLYVYTHLEYAYIYLKHAHAYTPRYLRLSNQNRD